MGAMGELANVHLYPYGAVQFFDFGIQRILNAFPHQHVVKLTQGVGREKLTLDGGSDFPRRAGFCGNASGVNSC